MNLNLLCDQKFAIKTSVKFIFGSVDLYQNKKWDPDPHYSRIYNSPFFQKLTPHLVPF